MFPCLLSSFPGQRPNKSNTAAQSERPPDNELAVPLHSETRRSQLHGKRERKEGRSTIASVQTFTHVHCALLIDSVLRSSALSKCCPYGGYLTTLAAIFSTMAVGLTYFYTYDKFIPWYGTTTHAFAAMCMILAGPLYFAIMLLCCYAASVSVTSELCF